MSACQAPTGQTNTALVVAIGDGATVDHVAIVEGFSAASIHVGSCLARLGADARLTSFTLTATAGLVRRQSFVRVRRRAFGDLA